MEDKEAQVLPMPSFLKMYTDFSQRTSMHGLGRVSASRSRHRKCLWCVVVLGGFAVTAFHFVKIFNDYFSYPVTTVVSMRHEAKMRFPAITICNINRRRRSSMGSLTDVQRQDFAADSAEMPPVVNELMRVVASTNVSSEHQLSDMLISCIINKRFCSVANFTEVKSASHGNCYTFKSEDPEYRYTTRPGPLNGLSLELDIEHREYIYIAPTAGIQVIIHEHDEKPFPEDGGIYAHPGATTSIGLRKTVTRRLPKPYGNCINALEAENLGLILFVTEMYKYTETACRKSCFQLSVYMKCNCCDADVPCNKDIMCKMAGVAPELNQTIGVCEGLHDFICMRGADEEYSSEESQCIKSCLPPCDQHTYEKVVSTGLWPSDPHLGFILYKINKTVSANMTFTSTASLKQFIKTNFLRLDIYFDSLDYLEFATYPKYDWSMLLGSIGGHLGLWLGFSLLTGMEFIELFLDTVITFICRYKT